ncbi:hypothetical protein Tco_1204949 [Tanacetum coccineum]
MFMTIQSSVKDKILATLSETSQVENAPAEMLRTLDQQMEKRADDGKKNVVIDALRRKERVKPRRIRAMAMTIRYGVRGMMLAAQSEAFKQENGMIRTVVMDEAHASSSSASSYTRRFQDVKLARIYIDETIARNGILYCLKVSPCKGVVGFGKKGKLAPRYVEPFEILERIGSIAYRLRLPEELSGVHDTFHVSNLKKCLADASLHVPLDEIKVDKTLRFVEEPVEIMDRDVKRLKRSKISLVKVRWNSKRGPRGLYEV